MKVTINYFELVRLTCDEYGITQDEFFSSFKYGNIPDARQAVVYLLKEFGLRGKEISNLTGFLPPRISMYLKKAQYFGMREHTNKILETLNYGITKQTNC